MRRAGRADTFLCARLFCFFASIAIAAAIKYGAPIEINHWDTGRTPLKQMVDVTNEFGLKVLTQHNFLNDNNIAFSPYGLMGIMMALYEGVNGDSSYEIHRAMQLPWNRNVMRVGFRDIHRTLKTYFVPEEGFLAGLALNSDNVIFNESYKEVLRFYGFEIENGQTTTSASTTTNANVTVDETSTTTLSTENMSTTDKETTTNPTETSSTEVTQESTTVSTQTTSTSTTEKTTISQTTQTNLVTSTTEMSATTKPSNTTNQMNTTSTTTESNTATTPNTTMSENIVSTTEHSGTTNATTTVASSSTSAAATSSTGSTTNNQNSSTTESGTTPTTSSPTSGSTQSMQNVSTTESAIPSTETTSSSGTTTQNSSSTESPTLSTGTSGSTTNMQNMSTTGSVSPSTEATSTSGSTSTMQNMSTTGSVSPSTEATSTSGSTTTMQNMSTTGSVSPSTEATSTSGSTTTTQNMSTTGSVSPSTEVTSSSGSTTIMQNTSTTENVTLSTEASPTESSINMQNTTSPANVTPASESTPTSENTMNNTESVTNSTPVGAMMDTLARRKKSIDDYVFANPPYIDNYPLYRSFDIGPDFSDMSYGGDEQEVYFAEDAKKIPPPGYGDNHMFLANGIKNVEVTYMSYDATLEHAFLPHLEASALRLPLDSDRYYLLLVLPARRRAGELARLLARMARGSDLSDIYSALRPKRVRALVPSFFVKGHITLTTDLQRLGLRNVFQPRQNDFTPMTSQPGVYVRSIEQAVSVAIRKYSPDETKKIGHAANRQRAYFSATYPFLYFVMDSNINVALMAGKLVDPLNSRIL